MLKKSHKKKRLFILVLVLIGMLLLSSCAKTNCNYTITAEYPIAGERVADELENLSAEDFPYTWEWIGRINRLREELLLTP